MKQKHRDILLRISGMLFIMDSIENKYHQKLLTPIIQGIKYILEDEDRLQPNNELRDKSVDPKRMELSGNCPYCNNPILFKLYSKLDKEKLWECNSCHKEFKIGEY